MRDFPTTTFLRVRAALAIRDAIPADCSCPTRSPGCAGTLGGLIAAYKSGPRFQTRALRTRSDYHKVFDYLHPLADVPLTRFDSALVVGIQEKAWKTKGRRFANYVVAVLSIIFNWGKPRLLVTSNPAERIEDIERAERFR